MSRRRLAAALATLATLALILPWAALAAPPPAYTAQYEVRRNGEVAGRATVTFVALGNGRYELRTHTVGSEGLAAIAGVDVDERSVLRWSGSQAETTAYSYRQKLAWKTRERSLQVDATHGRIDGLDKGAPYTLPYRAGVLDRHALTVVMMQDLAAGQGGDLLYPVATRDAIETQRFRRGGEETLDTALGRQPAVRVERIRNDGENRRTTIWFGPRQRWIPLQLRQSEGNGDSVEMRILSLR